LEERKKMHIVDICASSTSCLFFYRGLGTMQHSFNESCSIGPLNFAPELVRSSQSPFFDQVSNFEGPIKQPSSLILKILANLNLSILL